LIKSEMLEIFQKMKKFPINSAWEMLGSETEHAGAGIGVNVDCSVGFGGEDCLAVRSQCDGGLEGFSPPPKGG
jgi:hypothetical protein